jgi:hypothetical protein
MAAIAPTVTLYATLGSAETNLTADVLLGTQSMNCSYGIKGAGPLNRVAQTGTLVFSLNNSVTNSGGVQGYYTPGHANARANWDIGVIIYVGMVYDGTTYVKFYGSVNSIRPDAGEFRRQTVTVTCTDWMDEAAVSKLKEIAVQSDERSSALVNTIVINSVGRQPLNKSLATGISTFAYALDNFNDTKTTVMRALADATMSEMGFLYIKGAAVTTGTVANSGGILTFESRHTRPLSGDPVYTFDETMVAMNMRRSRQDVFNQTFVTVHPRTLDTAATVLWELTTTEVVPSIPHSSTITMIAEFTEKIVTDVNFGASTSTHARGSQIASTNLTTPVSGTDWIANAAADGSGASMTSDIAMTISITGANTALLQFVNSGSNTAYLTTVQLRGIALRDDSATTLSQKDATSITAYGEQDVRIDMPYESDVNVGLGIAQWQNAINADARNTVPSITILGNKTSALLTQTLAREPGDKIGLVESMTGILGSGNGFFINGVDWSLGPGSIFTVRWSLVPADWAIGDRWILDQVGASELGDTTILGAV